MERKKLLVVVDDDIRFRETMISIFRGLPVEVLGFASGEEATEFICEMNLRPDLVVLDVELQVGGLSGVEVAHKLREECRIQSPILFLSEEPTVDIWSRFIPGSRALSKQSSLRKIMSEIVGGQGSSGPALIHFD